MENIKMTEWKTVKIGDLGKIITGKTPSTKVTSYWGNDVPFVTPRDIQISRYIYMTEKLLSTDGMFSVRSSVLPKNAVCVSCIGNIGYVSLTLKECVSNQQINSIVVSDENDACFVYYLMKSLWGYFKKYEGQSTALSILNKSQFSNIDVNIPPLEIQGKIAGILGALDDRIDVLRRENVVLEQMAQAVFQSWFVDFDIVRAKAAGTPESEVCEKYHITPELYALFPSALTPDNLPLGWEKKKLGELVQNIKKSVKPSVETEHKPYVPIDCITAKTLTLYDFKDGKEAQSSLISFESRDILFGAMRAYFHKVCIAPFAGTTRSTVFCLRPKAPKDFSFALLSIFQNRCISYASQNSKGTTMPYAVWDNNLSEYQTEASTEDMRVAFNEYLGNSFDKMMLNAQQIRALSATRDALLPQLLGGKIEA